MKAVGVIVLIALIAIPSSSFAWSRGRAVGVRPGFPGRFVAAGFAGGLATGIVLNRAFFPRSYYYPGRYIYYYPPRYSYYPYYPNYYPPAYSYYSSYSVPPSPPPVPAPSDAYDRGYSEGYSQGYEEAQKERAKERYEEGQKRGYEEGYEAGKDVQNP